MKHFICEKVKGQKRQVTKRKNRFAKHLSHSNWYLKHTQKTSKKTYSNRKRLKERAKDQSRNLTKRYEKNRHMKNTPHHLQEK